MRRYLKVLTDPITLIAPRWCFWLAALMLTLTFFARAADCTYDDVAGYTAIGGTWAYVPTQHDGDTFTAQMNTRENCTIHVRMYGVDAPEKNQPFGAEAAAFLRDRLTGATLRLARPLAHKKIKMSYQRFVLDVFTIGREDSRINGEMAMAGMAWWDPTYAKKDLALRAAMHHARMRGLGLWGAAVEPIRPSDWRKGKR